MTTINLCRQWRKVGEVTSGTLQGVVRSNQMGDFELSAYRAGIDLAGGNTVRDIDTMYLVDEAGLVVFAGFVGPIPDGERGGVQITVDAEGERVTFSGPDLWDLLARRRCYPDPTTESPWLASHHTLTGTAGEVAATYIERNAGSGALPERRIPGLATSGSGVGVASTWSARLQRLDEQVSRVCNDSSIACRPTLNLATAETTFRFEPPADLSNTVVLSSEGEELTSWQTNTAGATTTFQIVGGQGQLTARAFASLTSGPVAGARRESYADYANLATLPELNLSAASQLARGAATVTVTATPTDAASQRVRYLRDYQVGDAIGLHVDGTRYAVRVEAVAIEVVDQLLITRPQLGRGLSSGIAALLADVSDLKAESRSTIA